MVRPDLLIVLLFKPGGSKPFRFWKKITRLNYAYSCKHHMSTFQLTVAHIELLKSTCLVWFSPNSTGYTVHLIIVLKSLPCWRSFALWHSSTRTASPWPTSTTCNNTVGSGRRWSCSLSKVPGVWLFCTNRINNHFSWSHRHVSSYVCPL